MQSTAKEIHTNFFNWLQDLSILNGKEVFIHDGICMLNSQLPHPMYNYICINEEAGVDPIKLENCIKEFIEKKIPFFLNNGITNKNKSSDLALIDTGIDSIGLLDGMIYDLAKKIENVNPSIEISIKAVRSKNDYRDFAEVMALSAEIDPFIGRKFFVNLPSLENSPFILFVAYYNKQPVGCSMLYVPPGEIAGNYYDWVLPNHRKKGINSAMVVERLRAAKDLGCKYVIAQCMDTSTQLYSSLEFDKVCELEFYGKMNY